MRRGFLNQKLGKRNSRRVEFERGKNELAKVAGGSTRARPAPRARCPGRFRQIPLIPSRAAAIMKLWHRSPVWETARRGPRSDE
jgi:hypothetical protein